MRDTYESPFNSRYASREMLALFSPDHKFRTWRRLWIALAQAEQELGLPVSQAQIDELIAHKDDINYEVVARKEAEIRHDVMAHVYAYGEQCPNARGILHLGATSCYVTDNTDILILKEALLLVRGKLQEVMSRLSGFAQEYKSLPTLGLTHLQPAQPVTVGKRACLWMSDLLMDIDDLDHVLSALKLLGSKGTTGTQASFLALFDGDDEKTVKIDELIARKMGMNRVFAVTGQTYSRKVDSRVLGVLSGIAQSAYKFAQDLRLLQSMREVEEPFEKDQVGSSAMAYKRNPMRSERICALSRHVIALYQDTAMTASTQWFERTLDDSANRRIALSEAFLAIDAVLEIFANIASGLVVYPKMIERNLRENLPFMATENILMEAVKQGGDRQALHERIRIHSHAAAARVKLEGLDNDLLQRIASDGAFHLGIEELQELLDPSLYIGRCPKQVEEFLATEVVPKLANAKPVAMGELRV